MYIAFEGIDGAGTTTQTGALCSRLMDAGYRRPTETCQPTGALIGSIVRKILGGEQLDLIVTPELLGLLFAADRLHSAEYLRHAMDGDSIVVSDRSVYSSLAYQGVITKDDAWVEAINKFACVPDMLIFIETEPSIAARRLSQRVGELEEFDKDMDLQVKVAERYKFIADNIKMSLAGYISDWPGGEAFLCKHLLVYDGSIPAECLSEQIASDVISILKKEEIQS
jgi:dTMP kinase